MSKSQETEDDEEQTINERWGGEVEPLSDEEWDAIYEEYDIFITPRRASNNGAGLHLPPEDDENERYCDPINNAWTHREYTDKAVATYPKKYRDICDYCVFMWRQDGV